MAELNKLNKTILIVEDEISLLKALEEKFQHEGFEVLKARDGEEGLQLAIDAKPDIILLDIIMPKMDGITMLKELRKDAWGKEAKIILLTNLSSPEAVTEAIQNNVYDYLVKTNWKLESIVEKVKTMLGLA